MPALDPYSVYLRTAMIHLKAAIDEYKVEVPGVNLTGMFIILPSGLAIKLDDIQIPSLTVITKAYILVGDIKLYIPEIQWNLDGFIPVPFLMAKLFLGLFGQGDLFSTVVKDSEHWYFGGPFREDMWPPKVGTDPAFSTLQQYNLGNFATDLAFLALITTISFALTKVGLSRVEEKFVAKLLTNGTMDPDAREKKIYEYTKQTWEAIDGTTEPLVIGMRDNLQSTIDKIIETGGLKDLIASIKTAVVQTDEGGGIIHVGQSVIATGAQVFGIFGVINAVYNTLTNKFKSEVDFTPLTDELEANLDLLKSWLTYLDDFSAWLANPIGRTRPTRPS
jgi:hypothetical protein